MRASMTKAGTRLVAASAALCLCAALALAGDDAPPRILKLEVEPARIELQGAAAEHGLLATADAEGGRRLDVTRDAIITSSNPQAVAIVDQRVRAVGAGEAEISVTFSKQTATIKVVTTDTAPLTPPSFRNEVVPVLTRYGCNQ